MRAAGEGGATRATPGEKAMADDHYITLPGDPRPWHHADDRGTALALLARLRAEDPARWDGAVATPYGEWLRGEQDRRLAEPAREVGAREFAEAMDLLPPIPCHGVGSEAFLVPEAVSDGVHRQYARFGDRHATRLVRRGDRSTYLTEGDLPGVAQAMAA